jgi:hypothetical protein
MRADILRPLESVSRSIQYGYTAKSSIDVEGPKYLRITDIQDRSVDWSCVPHCEIEDSDFQRYRLKSGDIVFARSGATVGKSFLIREAIPDSVFASYLIRVTCDERLICPHYAYYFSSPPNIGARLQRGRPVRGSQTSMEPNLGRLKFRLPRFRSSAGLSPSSTAF